MPGRAIIGRRTKGQAGGCCDWFPPAAWREIQPGGYCLYDVMRRRRFDAHGPRRRDAPLAAMGRRDRTSRMPRTRATIASANADGDMEVKMRVGHGILLRLHCCVADFTRRWPARQCAGAQSGGANRPPVASPQRCDRVNYARPRVCRRAAVDERHNKYGARQFGFRPRAPGPSYFRRARSRS